MGHFRISSFRGNPMTHTAADVLIEVLADWGVEVVFGLPGDGINGIMEALRKRQNDIRRTLASARMMEAPSRHCRNSRSERSMSYCSTGFLTRGPFVEITNGTASIRNPDTPS